MAGKTQGGALKEALEKWKRDQARNQAFQTKLADEKAKRPKKEAKPRASTSGAGKKATPSPAASEGPLDMKAHLKTAVKPRTSGIPLSKQLKDCLDVLQREQEPLTAAALREMTGHECSPGSELAEHLAKNLKVGFSEGRYRFKAASEVKVRDRSGALKFVQSSKGCLLRDLTAAYPEAAEDIAQLQSEGKVWVLPAAEKDQKAIFSREKPPMISVSMDVMKLWHEVEVPDDPEEQARDLKRANITSAVQRGKRERPKPAKKEKKKRAVNFDRFKRITNEHMPELFVGDAATSID